MKSMEGTVQVSNVTVDELRIILAEHAVNTAKESVQRAIRRMNKANDDYYFALGKLGKEEDMLEHLREQFKKRVPLE